MTKRQSLMLLALFFLFNLLFVTISWGGLHDPTAPALSDESKQKSYEASGIFHLQSIIIGPKRRLAMINNQMLGVGSTIQGARVLAIDKNHVVLLIAGQKQSIQLFGNRLWKAH